MPFRRCVLLLSLLLGFSVGLGLEPEGVADQAHGTAERVPLSEFQERRRGHV